MKRERVIRWYVLAIACFMLAIPPADANTSWIDEVHQAFEARTFQKVRLKAERVWQETQIKGETLRAGLAAAHVGAALTMLGQFEDAKQWQDRSEESLKTYGDVMLLGRLEVARAIRAYLDGQRFGYGDLDEAYKHLARAKEFLGRKDLALQMVELEILGRSTEGEDVQAGYLGYQSLIGQFAQLGDSLQVGRCVARLARLDGDTGGHEGALGGSLRAASIFKAAGRMGEGALALRNAGHASRKLGRYDVAESMLIEGLKFAKENQRQDIVVMMHNDLSRLYGEMGKHEKAQKADIEAGRMMKMIGDQIRKGHIEDAVPLNYHHLVLLRFASLLPYEVDLQSGFFDQLLLRP